MMRPLSLNRPLPPIPRNDVVHEEKLSIVLPPLANSHFPGPLAPSIQERALKPCSIIHSTPECVKPVQHPTSKESNSMQPYQLQRPRPRVPRMGTSMQPMQNAPMTCSQRNTTPVHSSSFAHVQLTASRSLRGNQNLAFETASISEENCPAGSPGERSTKLDLTGPERKLSSLHFLLSSARNGSMNMSHDFRKLFRRQSQFPNNHRLTTISEWKQQTPVVKKGEQGRSRSASSCDYSDNTETTSLSLTWPMSRSQHDVSNQVYRSASNLLVNDPLTENQYFGMSVETNTADTNSQLAPNSSSTGTGDKENNSSTLSPTLTEARAGGWTNGAAEEWLRMVDTEDMLRNLKRMRIISLTAKQWKIKRRPDGTRYLSCRKSHESKMYPQQTSVIHDHGANVGGHKNKLESTAYQSSPNHVIHHTHFDTTNMHNQHSSPEQTQSRCGRQKRSKGLSPHRIIPRHSISIEQNTATATNVNHSTRRHSRKRDSIKLTSVINRDDEETNPISNFTRVPIHEDRHRRASSQTIFGARHSNIPAHFGLPTGRAAQLRNIHHSHTMKTNQVLRDLHLLSNCYTYTTARSNDSSTTAGSTKLVTMLVV